MNKLVAAVYSQKVHAITLKKGGVGSLEETLSAKLIAGANFIAIDNVRGKIDSQFLESVLTEDRASCRVPYMGTVDVDPRRTIFAMTSNRAEITSDLANRASCIRILKRPEGYRYRLLDGRDILDHVRADPIRYMSAVFAVIAHWHRLGKPRTNDVRHDFRPWAQSLDFVVQEILREAPLLDGHLETKQRMTNPDLNWLRDVALAVKANGKLGCTLQANELIRIADVAGLKVPGVSESESLEESEVTGKACQITGRILARCFNGGHTVSVDGFTIKRIEKKDDSSRNRKHYHFTDESSHIRSPNPPFPRIPPIESICDSSDNEDCSVSVLTRGTWDDGGNGDSAVGSK